MAAVPLYVIAAWRCAHVARARDVELVGREATCWWILSAVMLGLGIYKLLDLQTAFADMGRIVALEHRWYDRRRPIQFAVVAVLAGMSALGIALAVWFARRAPLPSRVAAAGGAALVGFVSIRTISFHYVDALLNLALAGVKVGWVIEIGGILTILLSIRRRVAGRFNNQ